MRLVRLDFAAKIILKFCHEHLHAYQDLRIFGIDSIPAWPPPQVHREANINPKKKTERRFVLRSNHY